MLHLAAVILTKNEARHITACIAAVQPWVDAVIVWDAMSTDATCALARAAGALVVQRPWDNFAAQRQAVLDTVAAEWILFIDADERVTPTLGQALQTVLADTPFGLATWIGSRDKNVAWDLLCEAKGRYDLVMASGRLSESEREAASRQLGVCEGSDWCWWFGDYNPPESVRAMDIVYRASLARLYELLALAPPEALSQPISVGGVRLGDTVGAMRRSTT